jgi:hypothetical protein
MYSRNVAALLNHMKSEGGLRLDLSDEITGVCCVTAGGQVRVVDGRIPAPEAHAAAGV